MIFAIPGGLLVTLSALLFYLAAPHQKWGAIPCAPRILRGTGLALLLGGTALLHAWAGPATAIFITVTLLMAILSILPLAIAWRRAAMEGGQ